jgi:rhodanese-related sulfurtransferase
MFISFVTSVSVHRAGLSNEPRSGWNRPTLDDARLISRLDLASCKRQARENSALLKKQAEGMQNLAKSQRCYQPALCRYKTSVLGSPNIFQLSEKTAYGGSEAMQSITATELKQRLDNGEDVQIVDVREANEVAIGRIPNSIHIPLAQVLDRMSEIDPTRDTVVHCKMGGRSARAIEALQRSGYAGSLSNLTGGIISWSNDVDPSVPKY